MDTIEWFAQMLFLILIISVSSLKWYQSSHIQMTEHDLFKEILSDVALYQNIKSQYLSYFFNNVLQHDYCYVKHMPLPRPSFPETHNESWLVVLQSMHPPQLWFLHEDCPYLFPVSFTDSRRCLKHLRYHQRKKITFGLGQGVLVAILGHKSTQLPCGWRVLSVFL